MGITYVCKIGCESKSVAFVDRGNLLKANKGVRVQLGRKREAVLKYSSKHSLFDKEYCFFFAKFILFIHNCTTLDQRPGIHIPLVRETSLAPRIYCVLKG